MNKQKRMIYIYEENLAFYDELENKSEFINDALQDARVNKRVGAQNPDGTPKQSNIDYVRERVAAMDAQAKEK